MKNLQWLKMPIGIFNHPKVRHMLLQPNGDSLVIVWQMLKDMAGEINDEGRIYLSKDKAMTVELLARHLHRRRKFIDKALDLYEGLDLISRDEDGIITILTWDDDQSCDKLDRMRENSRNRSAAYRERKKKEAEQEKDTAGPELPEEPKEPLKLNCPSTKYYERLFGGASSQTAQKLAEMEQDWGEERVHEAIDVARHKCINGVKFIEGVIRENYKQEKERENYDRDKEVADYVDELLRQAGAAEPDSRTDEDNPQIAAH